MQYFEFINYMPILNDAYMEGIATVRLNLFDSKGNSVRVMQRFGHMKGKQGGHFFKMAAYGYKPNGSDERKWATASAIDSTSDNEMLMQFLEENARKAVNSRSVSGGTSLYPQSVSSAPSQSNVPNFGSQEQGQQQDLPF